MSVPRNPQGGSSRGWACASRTRRACCLITVFLFMLGWVCPAKSHEGPVILECDVVGSGGNLANLRGIRFQVDRDFESVEVRMAASVPGQYALTAELRRSVGFSGPILAAVRVSADLPETGNPPYAVVHIDFPRVSVTTTDVFTLRFVDITGQGRAYIESSILGDIPCPRAMMTANNADENPDTVSSATGLRVLAGPSDCGDCVGDLNGDHVVNFKDVAILADNWLKRCIPAELPVLVVESASVPPHVASGLAEFFGVDPKRIVNDNGVLRFTDPTKFQEIPTRVMGEGDPEEDKIPTLVEHMNLDAIGGQVLDEKTAVGVVREALASAKFQMPQLLQAGQIVNHSMLHAVDLNGKTMKRAPLDTQVNYEMKIGNIPVMGPGAKIKFVLNGKAELTHMTMGLPAVQAGESYPIIPQTEADALAMEAYGFGSGQVGAQQQHQGVELTSELVYWAPAGAENMVALQPHYLYGGTVPGPAGQGDIQLRRILIPAFVPGTTKLRPQVSLSLDELRDNIYATAQVGGGTPPYNYQWTSSTTDLSDKDESSIMYKIAIREGQPIPTHETVTVLVTDAAGVSVSKTQTIMLDPKSATIIVDQSTEIGPLVGGIVDAGTEWVGTSQGLGGSSGNAQGFDDVMRTGAHFRFNWGDYSAWERDFKDPSFTGGDDTDWVDNVDMVFYTGHANGNYFTFPGSMNDGQLVYNEARWGNNDLEWLVIAACGPLQIDYGGKAWWQRWGPAFRRLHLLCGYQTVSNDNTVEGRKLANYLMNGWKVRTAWMQTGIEVQPSSVWIAVMGAIGDGGTSNSNDHFWGRGSVGPDIFPSQIIGYWMVYSPS